MGGGYSKKYVGTAGAIGEQADYQHSVFEELPVRTKGSVSELGIAGGGGVVPLLQKKACSCCKRFTLPLNSEYEICPVCGWIDDPYQNSHPDSKRGRNQRSLIEARREYTQQKN